jgi:hypothetical protein
MAQIRDLLNEGKRYRIIIENTEGKQLIQLAAIWALVITLVAPQLTLLVVLGALLEIVKVGFEEVETDQPSSTEGRD